MNTELRNRLLRLNAGLAGSRLSAEDAIWLACDLLVELGIMPMTQPQASWWFARDVAQLMLAGELDRENGENELWALGIELGNVDLMPARLSPARLSPAEIVRTADEQLSDLRSPASRRQRCQQLAGEQSTNL